MSLFLPSLSWDIQKAAYCLETLSSFAIKVPETYLCMRQTVGFSYWTVNIYSEMSW